MYVRRINFNGTDSVNDEVFRREMRQLEGGYLSNALVDRSKILIQRLPYVEKVEQKSKPVAGSPDLVDVDFKIKEGLPGQFGGSLGFSETYGVTLGGNFIHSNFMGTGKRVALQITGGKYQKIYDANFTDPYRNIDGVARTLSLTYQDITQFTSATSDFSTTTLTAASTGGTRSRTTRALRFGFSYQDAELVTSAYSSQQALDWVQQQRQDRSPIDATACVSARRSRASSSSAAGRTTRATRRCSRRPARALSIASERLGSRQRRRVLRARRSTSQKYIPMRRRWLFRINSELSYGDALRRHDGAAAVPQPLRRRPGLRARLQGKLPRPARQSAAIRTAATCCSPISSSSSFPTPAKIAGSTRVALFFDVGDVFSTGGVNFFDKLGDPIDYGFDYDRLKKSVGIGVEWLAPLGLLRFSYATPLNEDARNGSVFTATRWSASSSPSATPSRV